MSLKLIKGGKTDPEVRDTMEEVTEDDLNGTPEERALPIIIHLTSGEDLVATVVSVAQDTITVINPLVLVMQPNERGVGLQLVPFFMPYARGGITINTGNIVAYLREFDPQIAENYAAYFSPIIQPSKKIELS